MQFKPSSISSQSAAKVAAHYLREGIDKNYWPEGRLPSIDNLAKAARVSRVPLWKAVQVLKGEGLLTSAPRGGIWLAGHPMPSIPPAPQVRWAHTKSLFVKDVLDGRFGRKAELPPVADLRRAYGVGHATVRKIIAAAVQDGFISPYKKGWRLGQHVAGRYRPTVTFIADGWSLHEIIMGDARMQDEIKALEAEAESMGLRLQPVGFNSGSVSALTKLREYLKQNGDPAGYVVSVWWTSLPELAQRILDLLRMLAATKKPVAVHDPGGDFTLPDDLASAENIHLFRIAGVSAGRAMGRFLLGLGHRHIAFISAQHNQRWSVERYKGLHDLFGGSGSNGSVTAVITDQKTSLYELTLSLCPFDRKALRKLYEPRLFPEQLADWLRLYDRSRQSQPLSFVKKKALEPLRADLAALERLKDSSMEPAMHNYILDYVFNSVETKALGLMLGPVFSRTLGHTQVSAWVCANDAMALAALQFHVGQNIPVPGTLSIAGFDNIPASFNQGLTTFDFNIPAIIRRMLVYAVSTPRIDKSKTVQVEEVSGVVIERRTTGRAKS